MEVLVRREAKVIGEAEDETPDMPGFGVPMSALYGGQPDWYVLDDEGDGATFCAGTSAFLDAMRAAYEHVNASTRDLEDALNAAGDDLE
jgi:hypothetical protein